MEQTFPKIEYQHFYNEKREPRVTVCYLRFEHHTAIGVAICSQKDRPCKKIGRGIALQRAQYAARDGSITLPVQRREALCVTARTDLQGVIYAKSECFYGRNDMRYSRVKP